MRTAKALSHCTTDPAKWIPKKLHSVSTRRPTKAAIFFCFYNCDGAATEKRGRHSCRCIR
jgi:hypothetical protein